MNIFLCFVCLILHKLHLLLFFDNQYLDDWIVDDFSKKVIKSIDKGEVLSPNAINTSADNGFYESANAYGTFNGSENDNDILKYLSNSLGKLFKSSHH